MSKTSSISSLSELRERQEEIKAEQAAARNGLTSTLAAAPQKAKEYALEDLALPALGIGLAAYVGYRVLRSGKQENEEVRSVAHAAPAQHLQQPQRSQVATASAPQVTRPAREARATREVQTREVVKSGFNFASLITVGKLLIPATQAIIGVIQNQKANAPNEK